MTQMALAMTIMKVLELPEDIVNKCMSILHEQAGDLHKSRPGTVGAGAFGGATSGHDLEHHAGVAHQHVAEAIAEMVAGLQGYADNLEGFAKDLHERDFEAAGELDAQARRLLDQSSQQTGNHDYHDHNSSAPGLGSAPEGED
jgi:hypothetical protein